MLACAVNKLAIFQRSRLPKPIVCNYILVSIVKCIKIMLHRLHISVPLSYKKCTHLQVLILLFTAIHQGLQNVFHRKRETKYIFVYRKVSIYMYFRKYLKNVQLIITHSVFNSEYVLCSPTVH